MYKCCLVGPPPKGQRGRGTKEKREGGRALAVVAVAALASPLSPSLLPFPRAFACLFLVLFSLLSPVSSCLAPGAFLVWCSLLRSAESVLVSLASHRYCLLPVPYKCHTRCARQMFASPSDPSAASCLCCPSSSHMYAGRVCRVCMDRPPTKGRGGTHTHEHTHPETYTRRTHTYYSQTNAMQIKRRRNKAPKTLLFLPVYSHVSVSVCLES